MQHRARSIKLLESLVTRQGPSGNVFQIREWLESCNRAVKVNVELTTFEKLKGWFFSSETSDLVHASGRFFSIRGLNVHTEGNLFRNNWQQPIIDQPEIGLLGIIAKEIDGVLCFLLQAKIEPGNINNVQLSPTLQATRSNYLQIHKGRAPQYLEYFRNYSKYEIWSDQLQSEQGGRFLHKRNRNIIIKVDEPIPLYDNFIWLTLGQIKELMRYDNVINMDTRTVISSLTPANVHCTINDFAIFKKITNCSNRGAEIFESQMLLTGINSTDSILSWLADLKSNYMLLANTIPLRQTEEWIVSSNEIVRPDRKYFRVIGANIMIENREVSTWSQPLVQPMQEGICALILKRINSVIHVLVQAKLECGNLDILEFAPTVQCLTGNYQERDTTYIPEYLNYVLAAPQSRIICDVKQSEEGGRFFREQNRNIIIWAEDDFPEDIPVNYCWMTLGQLQQFLKYNNYLNIQIRSLLAMIDELSPDLENYNQR